MSQSRRVQKDEFKYVKGERKASEVETQFEMDSPWSHLFIVDYCWNQGLKLGVQILLCWHVSRTVTVLMNYAEPGPKARSPRSSDTVLGKNPFLAEAEKWRRLSKLLRHTNHWSALQGLPALCSHGIVLFSFSGALRIWWSRVIRKAVYWVQTHSDVSSVWQLNHKTKGWVLRKAQNVSRPTLCLWI